MTVRESNLLLLCLLRGSVEMLGGLRAVNGARVVSRSCSERTASLFAYLAYHPDRSTTRAELIEMFWPEADLDRGRMSLRTALSSPADSSSRRHSVGRCNLRGFHESTSTPFRCYRCARI